MPIQTNTKTVAFVAFWLKARSHTYNTAPLLLYKVHTIWFVCIMLHCYRAIFWRKKLFSFSLAWFLYKIKIYVCFSPCACVWIFYFFIYFKSQVHTPQSAKKWVTLLGLCGISFIFLFCYCLYQEINFSFGVF